MSKQSINSHVSVNSDSTHTSNAVIQFDRVSESLQADNVLVRPSQLSVWVNQPTTLNKTNVRRSAQRSRSHHLLSENLRTRSRPCTEDTDDDAGKRRFVSKSGAKGDNNRREPRDLLRRQTTTNNGELWPANHKDVSNVYTSSTTV